MPARISCNPTNEKLPYAKLSLLSSWEDDFEKHLEKSNHASSVKMGAVGAGLGAGISLLASPLLVLDTQNNVGMTDELTMLDKTAVHLTWVFH